MSKPATKTRALTLRPHEARRLAKHGRVLIVREVKPQPPSERDIRALSGCGYSIYCYEYDKAATGVWMLAGPIWAFRKLGFETQGFRCPFGSLGSELWGRETWSPDHAAFYPHWPRVYKADGYPAHWEIEGDRFYSDEAKEWFPFRWLPATTMPRATSRFPRLVLAACEVKRAGEATPDEIAATGLGNGPLDIPADRWCWFATIERSDA